jgi:hypothetical protein
MRVRPAEYGWVCWSYQLRFDVLLLLGLRHLESCCLLKVPYGPEHGNELSVCVCCLGGQQFKYLFTRGECMCIQTCGFFVVSAARSQLAIAEIQLDIAAREPLSARRRDLALEAQSFIDTAMTLLSTDRDEIGMTLISLTDVRLSRLLGRQEDRIARIHTIATRGLCLDDEAILGQAMTSLGDELAARGECEHALHRYHDVRHILDGSDIPALGIWALRGMHRIEHLGDNNPQ